MATASSAEAAARVVRRARRTSRPGAQLGSRSAAALRTSGQCRCHDLVDGDSSNDSRRPWRLDGAVDATRRTSRHGHCCSARSGEGSCATATPWEVSGAAASAGADPRMQATIGFFEDAPLDRRPLGGLRWERDEFSRDNNDDIDCVIAKDEFERVPRQRPSVCGQVDGVPDRGRGVTTLAARPEWPDRALDGEATPSHASAARMSGPPELRQRDPIPAGSGVATRSDETSKSSSRRSTLITPAPEGAPTRRPGAWPPQRCASAPPRSSRRDPGLQRHDGLACTDPAGDPCELAGFPRDSR